MISGSHGPPTHAGQGLRGYTWRCFMGTESRVKRLASPVSAKLDTKYFLNDSMKSKKSFLWFFSGVIPRPV